MNTEFIYTFICLSECVFYQVERTKVADLLHLFSVWSVCLDVVRVGFWCGWVTRAPVRWSDTCQKLEVPVVLRHRCPYFLHLGWKWSASRPTRRLVQRTDSTCLDGFCHCFPGWTLCLFCGMFIFTRIGQVCRHSSSRPDACLQT